jgi:hypothetical protein
MADKTGNLQDRGDMRFQDKPLGSPGLCPFKGADIAIVPVRYALDRSHHDPDPTALKPLPKDGVWTDLPDLISRKYTLRQLYDGYVYVFDETAKTFHEYRYSVSDSLLSRVKWLEQDIGQDQRSTMTGESKAFLLYPRTHTLHIGYSPKQWTWRICEHMRSSPYSRALWMKALDLNGYCRTMAERDTYPLDQMAEAVADVDHDKACTDDQRFADSAIPTCSVEEGDTAFVGTAADSYWLARVPDQLSSLIIALDDPLAVLNDLGTQLTNDQVIYGQWQTEHEHKSQMAQTVTALCGAASAPDKLPASVKDDPVRARKYLRDVDEYFTQRSYEENPPGVAPGEIIIVLQHLFPSVSMRKQLESRYGGSPTEEEYVNWVGRSKWRQEIDLIGAHAYLIEHQAAGEKLLQQVRDTQEDLRTWAEHIGTEPMKLFIDTNNPKTLLYLMSIMATLQTIISKDIATSAWLAEEEIEARSLFGLITFGFSAALKDALGKHANEFIGGISDQANVASRAGELNGALNHEGFANAPWMLALKQSTRDTFKALNDVAKGKGKAVIESILLALVPSNSRLSSGKQQNLPALLRNMLIDQVLLSASDKIGIDNNIHKKLGQWKRQWQILNKQIKEANHLWTYQTAYGSRAGISGRLQELKAKLQLHELSRPSILDYQNNQYADQLRAKMKEFAGSGADVAKEWHGKAKEWSQQLGGIATAVTYGVIMLNFLNTALTYRDLTRDGEFSKADMVKVTYNLGYSASLLMAVFVNAPWQVVKAAEPFVDGKSVGILEKTAAFWKKQGKPAWADAVFKFRRALAGVGGFAIFASVLELMELMGDLDKAKSSIEKKLIITKILAVGVMGIGGLVQLTSTFILYDSLAFAVMNPWFAVAMAVVGVIYLIASFALNYFKQDNVGWWLRKSCWSISSEHRYGNTLEENLEESRSLTEIQLSPQVFVKCTLRTGPNPNSYSGLGNTLIKNGAWVQIRLPQVLRGHLIQVNVAVSKRSLPIFPVELTDEPVQKAFEENGQFVSVEKLGNVSNNPYRFDPNLWNYPAMPPGNEDVIWQTWVPFNHDADFLELQIWYPTGVLADNKEMRGYLYQISLEEAPQMTSDGSSNTELSIQKKNRSETICLAVTE